MPSKPQADAFQRFRPHPWHGLSRGAGAPDVVTAYIEITPFDTVKYELDKETGYIRVDRPQRGSAQPPALYGFIPRTYCDHRVAALTEGAARGDGDPLDVCVLSERAVTRSDIILSARVLGGLQMLDGGEADDKIIAVLENDHLWGEARDLSDLPGVIVERLRHYFSTYKLVPGATAGTRVGEPYNRRHAVAVIEAAAADYNERFSP